MSELVQLGRSKQRPGTTVQVSARARTELQRLGVGGRRLMRIGVTPGGCAGHTYAATLDDELTESDEVVFAAGELKIVCAREQVGLLSGLRIDFSDDLVASGFRLTNANAGRACGCGSSFSA